MEKLSKHEIKNYNMRNIDGIWPIKAENPQDWNANDISKQNDP